MPDYRYFLDIKIGADEIGAVHNLDEQLARVQARVAELNRIAAEKAAEIAQWNSRKPPPCNCATCSRYGRDGLEGCLYPCEVGYVEAEARAASLLNEMLTPEQQESWATYDFFNIIGSEGNLYRLYRMPTYNVHRVGSRDWYCTLPQTIRWEHGNKIFPPSDGRVAQMLFLMTNETEFRRIANFSDGCLHPHGWRPND